MQNVVFPRDPLATAHIHFQIRMIDEKMYTNLLPIWFSSPFPLPLLFCGPLWDPWNSN